jgi:FMN-dependent oxidoreductase (nitrilotriacetate monooxygenase family)
MPTPFHLGWFTNFTQGDWTNPVSQGTGAWDGKFFVEFAQAMERACFDYIMLEDTLMVSEAYGGTAEATLKYALQVPKHDPMPLAAMIGAATSKLGVVATMSTLGYPPFMLARLASTLDHICGGRFGWNIVTSGEDIAAQNFGLDKLPPRETRYAMADEYVDLVCKLFDSWEPDAVVMDAATGTYADHTKVHAINFEGQFFKCRGPLNTVRSPQGKPVFVQAGGSSRGRAFAARHADSIIAVGNGVEGMKAYRDDVRRHAAAAGRDPNDVKVLFLVYPILGETDAEAVARNHRMVNSPGFVEAALAAVGTVTDIDFSGFELDQLAHERFDAGIPLIGSPDTVAERMGEAMEAIGGDGFLISTPFQRISRRFITEVCEGLVPALQRRGLARKAYGHTMLRDTLREF